MSDKNRVFGQAVCLWCKVGTMNPVVDERGELFTTQVQLIPHDMNMHVNFLAGYRSCQACGYTATFNLTLLETSRNINIVENE